MAFPTGTVTTDNLDAATDSPASARADLLLTVQKLNDIIGSYDAADGIAALDSGGLVVNTKLPNSLISSSGSNLTLSPATEIVKLNNVLELTPRTVAQLNALTVAEGTIAYCSNGNAGAKCLAVYDGSNFKVVALGATIATS